MKTLVSNFFGNAAISTSMEIQVFIAFSSATWDLYQVLYTKWIFQSGFTKLKQFL
jgi:hypothetical protein